MKTFSATTIEEASSPLLKPHHKGTCSVGGSTIVNNFNIQSFHINMKSCNEEEEGKLPAINSRSEHAKESA